MVSSSKLPLNGATTVANQLSYHQQQQLIANLKLNGSPHYYLKILEFKDRLASFNYIISEDLLERLCDLGKLNDSTLALFTSQKTQLKRFRIKNSTLSKSAINLILKQHQVEELIINNIQLVPNTNCTSANPCLETTHVEINNNNTSAFSNYYACGSSGCNTLNINDLIESLNPWSLDHLKHLNVARNTTLFSSILISLKQLSHLQKLNVSFTSFNNQSLDVITQDFINLEFLDMSGTRVNDLSPLARIKDKLKYLYMFNMRSSQSDDIVSVLCSLRQLRHLDVSCDVSTKIFADMTLSVFDVNLLLDELCISMLTELKYLDISGKNNVKEESLM
jgi:hypothetical protein